MARLYEHQSKEILKQAGIAVPIGRVASKPSEAKDIASEIGKPVVVKAQVWATGRYSEGGISFANSPEEAEQAASNILGKKIKGLDVNQVLIEEMLEVEKEFFIGVIISNSYKVKGPVIIFSSEGGSSIEEVSSRNPERISQLELNYLDGLSENQAEDLIRKVDYNGFKINSADISNIAKLAVSIYQSFVQNDARNLEINPLILTKDGRLLAADCHFTIDDNSVFRHPEFEITVPRDMERPPTELEIKAWKIEEGDYRGTGYFSQMSTNIDDSGWIGFHGIGGGGAMLGATAFMARGLKIATYADTSGDPPASKIYSVIKCILSLPVSGYVLMGAVLANQEMWHHAHALVKVFREEAHKRPGFPVVLLLAGNKEKESTEILKKGLDGLPIRYEIYGRNYIYQTDVIADRLEHLVKEYINDK